MPPRTVVLPIITAVLTISVFSQPERKTEDHTLARLSYQTSFRTDSDGGPICFAVYENGFYRMWKAGLETTEGPDSLLSDRSAVQGTLSKGQLTRLKAMLRELRPESSGGGGVVPQGAEVFTAELKRDGQSTNLTWVDADHRNAFPAAVSGLIRWLEDFKAENSSPVTFRELSDLPLCPRNTKPMPLIAGLEGRCLGK